MFLPYSPSNPFARLPSSASFLGLDRDAQLLANDVGPAISVDTPSDDFPHPATTPDPLQPREATPVLCSGVLVQWTPGTIWVTNPFPSHSFANHP